jgi:hypothetical protein
MVRQEPRPLGALRSVATTRGGRRPSVSTSGLLRASECKTESPHEHVQISRIQHQNFSPSIQRFSPCDQWVKISAHVCSWHICREANYAELALGIAHRPRVTVDLSRRDVCIIRAPVGTSSSHQGADSGSFLCLVPGAWPMLSASFPDWLRRSGALRSCFRDRAKEQSR